MRHSAALLLLASLAGCSPVVFRELRPDYDQADKKQTLRLSVVTAPLPDNLQQVGDMWSEIAKHFASDHRDFIVKATHAAIREPADACGEGIDAILRLTPQLVREEGRIHVSALATISRCKDGTVIWSAAARGTWNSVDNGLLDVTDHYTHEYGDVVTPYVAPSFRLLKDLLWGALPVPSIQGNDAAVEEKIESS